MARSPAKGGGSVTEQTTLILAKKGPLESLLEIARQSKKRQQSAAGTYGKALSEAVEQEHVSRFAFQQTKTWANLDDERLHVELISFIHYMKVLGVLKRGLAQEEMFTNEETAPRASKGRGADAKGDQPAGGRSSGGLKLVGDAARQVAEAAGADK